MFLRKIRSLHRNQAGFTLIEVIAALAITGLIGLGAAMANAQVINQTVKNNDYTTANRQVLNAIQWISRDAQMAQSIDNWQHFPATSNLTFTWVTWDNKTAHAVYSVDANFQLKRTYTITGSPPQVNLIAQYVKIAPVCTWVNEEFTITITGTVGSGARVVNVTRLNVTAPRPSL